MVFSFSELRSRLRYLYLMSHRLEGVYGMMAKIHREQLLKEEHANDPKKLAFFGFTAYSMGDEDGIQAEIFRRIGTTNRQFIEFGCGDGTENNTVYLLLSGWTGLWMDGSSSEMAIVRKELKPYLDAGKLQAHNTFITRDNINTLIRQAGLSEEPDLLVIDIDGNDYHIWEAIDCVRPRVVCVEYNATFRPPVKVVQEYKADAAWDGSNFGGASLKALEELGRRKGYALVGCSLVGSNSFYVREDLLGDHFSPQCTAENHFREAYYDAYVRGLTRHRRGVGVYRVLP